MSREIMRVPPGWEHPRQSDGSYRPDYLPEWNPKEATCYQIYETVSEGTPVSPIFDTLDELIAWMIERGYSEKVARNFARIGWVPSGYFSSETGYLSNFDVAGIADA